MFQVTDVLRYSNLIYRSTNLTELVKAIRMLAALSSTPDSGQRLLDAARKLAAATAGLLSNAQPENVDNR